MSRLVRLNAHLSVGGEPEPDQLGRVAAEGFRSVLDLREDGEPSLTSPEEEAERLGREGVEYRRCPVPPRGMAAEGVNCFLQTLPRLSTPVLVHCQDGRRAAMLTMIHVGIANGWDGEYTLEQARRLGWNFGDTFAADFVRQAVDARSRPTGAGRSYGDIMRTPR